MKNFNLFKKRKMKTILKSLAAIVAIGAVAGGATFAYFSDTETIKGNLITAGTLDLELDDTGKLPIIVEDAYPGMEETTTFKVRNVGTIPGHLRVEFSDPANIINAENGMNEVEQKEDSTWGAHAGELCENLEISLKNLDTNEMVIDGLSPTNVNPAFVGDVMLGNNDEDTLELTIKVNPAAENEIQSDKCGANIDVILVQDVDQDGTAAEHDSDDTDPSVN